MNHFEIKSGIPKLIPESIRPHGLEFSEMVLWNADQDFVGESGPQYLLFGFFLLVHSYQDVARYREEFLPAFQEFQKAPEAEDVIGKAALEDVIACISGGAKIDCAEMAFRKKYIKSLSEYSKMDLFKKYLNFFEERCQIYERG